MADLGDPVTRTAFQQLRGMFPFKDQFSKVEGVDVQTKLPQFSCSWKTGFSSPLNDDSSTNATPSKACPLSLALDYAMAAQDLPQPFTPA